jgi:RimJ/RimL family protein N-acetyltransferase
MLHTARELVSGEPVLESERLRLRPLTMADLTSVLALAGEREVAEQTARIPYPLTRAAAETWISAASDSSGQAEIVFAIERKQDHVFLGAVGLVLAGEGNELSELGYWLGRKYWNRGYATEAVRWLLVYVFEQCGLQAIRACTFVGNPASARVQEKVGMRLVGHDVQQAPARDCCEREAEVRELRREDWQP